MFVGGWQDEEKRMGNGKEGLKVGRSWKRIRVDGSTWQEQKEREKERHRNIDRERGTGGYDIMPAAEEPLCERDWTPLC